MTAKPTIKEDIDDIINSLWKRIDINKRQHLIFPNPNIINPNPYPYPNPNLFPYPNPNPFPNPYPPVINPNPYPYPLPGNPNPNPNPYPNPNLYPNPNSYPNPNPYPNPYPNPNPNPVPITGGPGGSWKNTPSCGKSPFFTKRSSGLDIIEKALGLISSKVSFVAP